MYILHTSYIHLMYILYTSYIHLLYISHHLIYISNLCNVHLSFILCTSYVHLTNISGISHRYITNILLKSYKPIFVWLMLMFVNKLSHLSNKPFHSIERGAKQLEHTPSESFFQASLIFCLECSLRAGRCNVLAPTLLA